MEKRSIFIFLGLLSLSLGLIASTCILTSTIKQKGTGIISVKGCAEKRIVSDYAKWDGYLSVTEETPIRAYEQMEKDIKVLQEYMTNRGVRLETVYFSPLITTPVHELNSNGNITNKIEKYILTQNFSFESSEITLITNTALNATELIKEGLSIHSLPPQYFYSEIDNLKIAMLGEAAFDARQRAEQLVCNSGCQVGLLRSAHQGVFQITPAYSNNTSDYGEYDTSSIDKKIKAVVTMDYAIN